MGLKRHKRGVARTLRRGSGRSELVQPRGKSSRHPPISQFDWAAGISQTEWATYKLAIAALRSLGVPFLLGGGFALATFTGSWRDTKDIDFYIKPQDRRKVVRCLAEAGFSDYFHQQPYDRKWIHRSVRSNVIVDTIWAMANQRARVDDLWFERAGSVLIRDEELGVVPMEELLWCKLYIMQRDHCDWTDAFNLVHAQGREMDWGHLLNRLGEDTPLLKAMLTIYGWLCPKGARELPKTLRDRLELMPPSPGASLRRDHIRLLDSRAWFSSLQPRNKKLQV